MRYTNRRLLYFTFLLLLQLISYHRRIELYEVNVFIYRRLWYLA